MNPAAATATCSPDRLANLEIGRQVRAFAAFAVGAGIPFTVPIIGLLPLAELVLLPITVWLAWSTIRDRAWPHPLFASRTMRRLVFLWLVSFASYVLADLWRDTPARDLVRGWARWGFLGVDLLALVSLLGTDWNHVRRIVGGFAVGVILATLLVGPQFDDYWKFGFAYPLTFLLPIVIPQRRLALLSSALAAIGVVHLWLGARSLGGVSLVAAALVWLPIVHRRARALALGLSVGAALTGVYVLYQEFKAGERAMGSTTERTAMLLFAWDQLLDAPLLGQGSWFAKGARVNEFYARRATLREEEDTVQSVEDGEVAIHSQILVALAEGGLGGGVFFAGFGWLLLSGLRFVATHDFNLRPLVLLLLLNGTWDLFMSTFSGFERVFIAFCCAILIVLRAHHRSAPAS